jgi:DNA-binding XRE family transcriptional regulator
LYKGSIEDVNEIVEIFQGACYDWTQRIRWGSVEGMPMVVNGQKVKELRESRGLTQQAAAEMAGFGTYQQWSNVERAVGKSKLRVDTLYEVARVLGVSMESLLKFVKPGRPPRAKGGKRGKA